MGEAADTALTLWSFDPPKAPKWAEKTRLCKLCLHAMREDIDEALIKGESLSAICKRYLVSYPTLKKHAEHVNSQLALSRILREETSADRLAERVLNLDQDAQKLFDKLQTTTSDAKTKVSIIGTRMRIVELLARMRGHIKSDGGNPRPGVTVNFNVTVEEAAQIAKDFLETQGPPLSLQDQRDENHAPPEQPASEAVIDIFPE